MMMKIITRENEAWDWQATKKQKLKAAKRKNVQKNWFLAQEQNMLIARYHGIIHHQPAEVAAAGAADTQLAKFLLVDDCVGGSCCKPTRRMLIVVCCRFCCYCWWWLAGWIRFQDNCGNMMMMATNRWLADRRRSNESERDTMRQVGFMASNGVGTLRTLDRSDT